MYDLVEQGIAAWQGDEELPSLIKMFRNERIHKWTFSGIPTKANPRKLIDSL